MTGSMRPSRRVGGEVAAELVERGGLGGALALVAGAGLGQLRVAEDRLAHRDAAGVAVAGRRRADAGLPEALHEVAGAALAEDGALAAGLGLDDHLERARALGADGAGHGGGEGLIWHVS